MAKAGRSVKCTPTGRIPTPATTPRLFPAGVRPIVSTGTGDSHERLRPAGHPSSPSWGALPWNSRRLPEFYDPTFEYLRNIGLAIIYQPKHAPLDYN